MQIVLAARTAHREDFTGEILVLGLARALGRQVFLRRDPLLRLEGHLVADGLLG